MLLQNQPLKPAIAECVAQPDAESKDQSFLVRLSQRDADAFDQMVAIHSKPIQKLVSRLLGWDNDCEDIVQEVFMAAWEKIGTFRSDSSLDTWLYSIALNQCRKKRRQRGHWQRVFKRLCETREPDETLTSEATNSTTSPDIKQIQAALNELPHRERELIVLNSIEGKSLDELQQILNIRKNALEVRLHRARRRLKQILKLQTESSESE